MGLWDNIKNIMTIPEEDEIEEEVQNEPVPVEEPKKAESPRIIKSKSVNYGKGQTPSQMQVVLVKPDRFDDVASIADHLNAGKTVVLNLEDAPSDVSRRIVDFLSGAAYANGGDVKKVAKNTFMITAKNVGVSGDLSLEEFDESKLYF